MKNMRVHQLAATFIFFVRIHLYISFSVLLAISECDFSCAFVRFLASRAEITLIALLPQLSVCLFRVSFGKRRLVAQVYNIFQAFPFSPTFCLSGCRLVRALFVYQAVCRLPGCGRKRLSVAWGRISFAAKVVLVRLLTLRQRQLCVLIALRCYFAK